MARESDNNGEIILIKHKKYIKNSSGISSKDNYKNNTEINVFART